MRGRTYAEVLDATLPWVDIRLFPDDRKAWWRRHPPGLPLRFASFAWECRLAGEAQVDLQAEVALAPGDAPAPTAGWDTAGRFLSRWRVACFLEIDQDERLSPLLFPRVEVEDRELWTLLAVGWLGDLAVALPPWVPSALEAAVARLPRGAVPRYAAWLGPRGLPHARFLASVPQASLPDWLGALGWPGDVNALAGDLTGLNPWSTHVPVAVDLLESGIGGRIGVELHWPGPPRAGDRTERMLDMLAAWPELDSERLAAARRWRWSAAPVHPRLQVKLSYEPGRRSAKAYLGAWTE